MNLDGKFYWIIVVVLIGLIAGIMVLSSLIPAKPVVTQSQPMENQELKIEDIIVGTGKAAENGDKLTVNYKGTLTDGKQFDNSYDRNQPFEFTLGQGQVIPGWDQGLVGMKIGGKRKLTIPSELGYGSQGSGPIPPNSTLIFEVELLDAAK